MNGNGDRLSNGPPYFPPPKDDWWRSEMGKYMCRGCGEERLVHVVTDFRGAQAFCQVCSRSWWLDDPPAE